MKTRGSISFLFLGALLTVIACSNAGDKPAPSEIPAADPPRGSMEVIASVDTARDTGIVKWKFDTAADGTIEMVGVDAQGEIRFTERALPPNQDGITEFHVLEGILQINANGEVIKSTLSAEAIDLAGRLRTDTEHHLEVTNVALSACSQAVDYYNACASAAAVAAALCVAVPTPVNCAAVVVALNFEAQARSAMNEACGSDGCGNHCSAPFTCDSGTGNCICVSSCSGPMCGQGDGCGNTCPSWDIDECGYCGGDGSSCGCPWTDCMGICQGPFYYDDCGVCGGDNSTCECPGGEPECYP